MRADKWIDLRVCAPRQRDSETVTSEQGKVKSGVGRARHYVNLPCELAV
jgi:hypothetical protein